MYSDPNGNSFILTIVIGVCVSLASKYVEDIFYNAMSGKTGWDIFNPVSPWQEYVAAGIIGGVTAGISSYISILKTAGNTSKFAIFAWSASKYAIDIAVRPALTQSLEIISGDRTGGFDWGKYGMDVGYRAVSTLTDFIPMSNGINRVFGSSSKTFIDELGRGILKGMPKTFIRAGIKYGKNEWGFPQNTNDIYRLFGGF